MKYCSLLFVFIFTTGAALAQNFIGDWEGTLKISGTDLQLVFHISENNDEYYTTMHSPQQGASDIAIKETRINGDSLFLSAPPLALNLRGKLTNNNIDCLFSQGNIRLPLVLKPGRAEVFERPQEPLKPFDYYTEEVSFTNTSDAINLSGTLSLPERNGTYPAIILLSGSGPQDRDSNVFNHKPFLILADHLTKNGIAVLRYDDRGTGSSTGDYASAGLADFKHDAQAALDYLRSRKEINTEKIGVLGHSAGGLIASMLAAENHSLGYVILLAAPGIPGDQMMIAQKRAIHNAMGQSEDSYAGTVKLLEGAYDIIRDLPNAQIKDSLETYLRSNGIGNQQVLDQYQNQLNNAEIKSLIQSNPAEYLSKITCPVLALNGSTDLQVVADLNLNGIEKALLKAKNNSVKVEKLTGLNHLFQKDSTGLPQNYSSNKETFSSTALTLISDWIKGQTE